MKIKISMNDLHTFFTITVPEGFGAREWADKYWDTYGFDYDTERAAHGGLLAWPCNDEEDRDLSVTELKHELDDGGIEYETFQATLNTIFGEIEQ
jgi:hypothetical protein